MIDAKLDEQTLKAIAGRQHAEQTTPIRCELQTVERAARHSTGHRLGQTTRSDRWTPHQYFQPGERAWSVRAGPWRDHRAADAAIIFSPQLRLVVWNLHHQMNRRVSTVVGQDALGCAKSPRRDRVGEQTYERTARNKTMEFQTPDGGVATVR